MTMIGKIEALKSLIDGSSRILILTGAGISTDSGLPDFRSDNGFWKNNKPIYFNDFVRDLNARKLSWKRNIELNLLLKKISPNSGHDLVREILDISENNFLVTQNIDGLHQKSGVSENRMIEIHGNATKAKCLECKKEFSLKLFHDAVNDDRDIPNCDACNSLVKVGTISFGQPMNVEDMEHATYLAEKCSLLIVLGSSLVVQPVASLPMISIEKNSKLVIINRDPTPYDNDANLVINAEINDVANDLKAI